jgi:hypothetical protein
MLYNVYFNVLVVECSRLLFKLGADARRRYIWILLQLIDLISYILDLVSYESYVIHESSPRRLRGMLVQIGE